MIMFLLMSPSVAECRREEGGVSLIDDMRLPILLPINNDASILNMRTVHSGPIRLFSPVRLVN